MVWALRKMKVALEEGSLGRLRDAAKGLWKEAEKIGALEVSAVCEQLIHNYEIRNFVWLERLYEKLLLAVLKLKYLIPVVRKGILAPGGTKGGRVVLTEAEKMRMDSEILGDLEDVVPFGYELVKDPERDLVVVRKKSKLRAARLGEQKAGYCNTCPLF